MKRIALLLLFPLCTYGQTFDEKVKKQLEKDKQVIKALNELRVKQLEAINEFVRKGPSNELSYDGKNLNSRTVSEIKIYDINENTLEIVEYQNARSTKVTAFQFDDGDRRPHGYLGNVFKLGGLLSYNVDSKKVTPDIMLMYEFFSFDKLLPFYGLSLNAGIGLQHVGGTLGYQFHKTAWFRNTSLHFGYTYNFIDMDPRPIFAISLNF